MRPWGCLRRSWVGTTAVSLVCCLVGGLLSGGLLVAGTVVRAAASPVTGATLAPAALEGSSNAVAGPSMTGQVFWAYVGAGGSLDVAGEFRNAEAAGAAAAVTVTATSPSGVAHTHTVPITAGDPYPAVSILGLTDPTPGVWRVVFDASVPGDDRDGGLRRWGITPRTSGGAALTGRVFADRYNQSAQALRPLMGGGPWNIANASWDQTLFFLNSDGVAYRARYGGINPIQGAIYASPRGVINTTGPAAGASRHASASMADPAATVDPARYRIFFETPDPALPAAAAFATKGTDWLGPDYHDPLVTDITHTSTASTVDGAWAGTISWNVKGGAGPAQVRIDTNRDGVFDRTLNAPVGANQVTWDGTNAAGKTLRASADVTVRVVMTETGEIHFTLEDVERLSGGLEVTALSGPEAGSRWLSWDDTTLAAPCETGAVTLPCASIPTPLAAPRVDSTGGVHAWAIGDPKGTPPAAGWGDHRYIDNWTTTTIDVVATAGLGGRRVPVRDDAGTTSSGKPVTIDVLANDTNTDDPGGQVGEGLTVTLASVLVPSGDPQLPPTQLPDCASAAGTWRVNPNESVTFTPAQGFRGTVTCGYIVTTADGDSYNAAITVHVENTVLAVDDQATMTSGYEARIRVLDNDIEVDPGSRVTVRGHNPQQGPKQGKWLVVGRDTVVFTPAEEFRGTATATYTVTEPDGTTSTGTVTVQVANRLLVANDRGLAPMGETVELLVVANDRYLDKGFRLAVRGDSPRHGRWHTKPGINGLPGIVVFTPAKGFHGTATATYTITEPDGTTDTATIKITVLTPGPAEPPQPSEPPRGDTETTPTPPTSQTPPGHGGTPAHGGTHGNLPDAGGPPLWIGLAGLAALALGGILIGVGCSGTRRRHIQSRPPGRSS